MKQIESDVMDTEGEHFTLCQDLDTIASVAGISQSMIIKSMKEFCEEEEVAYVRAINKTTMAGVVYVGGEQVATRMQAVAGACIRNFIDARVVMVKDILQGVKDGKGVDPQVALVPNFCSSEKNSGVAEWETTHLLGWLYDRDYSGKQTFVAVNSMELVYTKLGALIEKHLEERFIKI